VPSRNDERGWPRYLILVSAFHSNVRIFGQNRHQRSNNLTLARKDIVKCIDPNMLLFIEHIAVYDARSARCDRAWPSFSSTILRVTSTGTPTKSASIILREQSQVSRCGYSEPHAPSSKISESRLSHPCDALLHSNPCASTERHARDFMVGAKLRNAKRVPVVGVDCKMRGCPSCCRPSDTRSSPRRMSRRRYGYSDAARISVLLFSQRL
jgi:hypothetical protein